MLTDIKNYVFPKLFMVYININTWLFLTLENITFYKNRTMYRILHDRDFASPSLFKSLTIFNTSGKLISIVNVLIENNSAKYRFIHFLHKYWSPATADSYNSTNGFNMSDYERCFGTKRLRIDYQIGDDVGTGRNIKRIDLITDKNCIFFKTDLSHPNFKSELVFKHVDFDD
jgi:hypothetical protein